MGNNRVSSTFPKGGHSATLTEIKNNVKKHKVKCHRYSDTKTSNRESQENYRFGTVSNELLEGLK